MARYGLNLGEKVDIVGKQYRILNDVIENPSLQLGELTFIKKVRDNLVYEDDLSQPNGDGTYKQVATGEMLGFDVALRSKVHKEVFVTITEMPLSAFDDLGINFGDKVSLSDIVVTYSQVGSGEAKLFASSISKVGGQPQAPKQPKPEQHNDQK